MNLTDTQIAVNGKPVDVINTLSCGPNEFPHTFVLKDGYVRDIGGEWFYHKRGQFPAKVKVSF